MATYNFTVRATDNLGAYADRNFAITVNNTNVERFVAVGTAGLMHSPDGITWTTEPGQSGAGVTYGNGKWVVWGLGAVNTVNANNRSIRTSSDAFNWTTVNTNIESARNVNVNGTPTLVNNFDITMLKFRNGLWSAFVTTATTLVSSTYYFTIHEYTSPDLATWTYARSLPVLTNASNITAVGADYEYDPGSDTYVFTHNFSNGNFCSAYQRTGTTGWTMTYSSAQTVISGYTGSIAFTNGLWCITPGVSVSGGAVVYTSADGVGWTARTVSGAASVAANGLTYANGKLFTRTYGGTTSTTQGLYFSTNGGRSWALAMSPVAIATSGYSAAMRNPGGFYGGRLVYWAGDANQAVTSNDLSSFSQAAVFGPVTTFTGIAIRKN